jgi:hypothetical protein
MRSIRSKERWRTNPADCDTRDGNDLPVTTSPTFKCIVLLMLGLGMAPVHTTARAADPIEYVETFDGEAPSWRVNFGRSQGRLLAQTRSREFAQAGAAEHIAIDIGRDRPMLQLEHRLEPSRVFHELSLEVAVRSNTGGLTVWLGVTYPQAIDPATGRPIQAFVSGDIYREVGQWQTLRVATTDETMRDRLRRLRAELHHPDIDDSHAYVDRVVLTAELSPGRADVLIDDLRFGPVVPPAADGVIPAAVGADEGRDPEFPVELTGRRLRVEGQPFFPRLIAHHGEPVDVFREAAFNSVWVRDFHDDALLAELRRQDLWAIATPPRITSGDGHLIGAHDVSVLPFTERTRPILAFILGTRVPPDVQQDLLSWAEQTRSADHRFERPIMVDIAGDQERAVSRRIPMPGFSRDVLHTTFSLRQYREWLRRKHLLARPGSFIWTWIQTEPTSTVAELRQAAQQTPAVVEPEQVRLQVYAAVSAGCRGLGYWTTSPLNSDAPGARERRLMLAQLNMELSLLEPLLATGVVRDPVPFTLGNSESAGNGLHAPTSRNGEPGPQAGAVAAAPAAAEPETTPTELEAAVIRSEYGTLLLPMWYGRDAQFVPGQLAGRDATVVVHGVEQTARAFEISPTQIRVLPRQRVPGGIQVKLAVFDQTAAIVLTSNPSLISELNGRRSAFVDRYARVSLDLAQAKLDRVAAVDTDLQSLGVGLPDGPDLLARARRHIELAVAALERSDWPAAVDQSAAAMQTLRILQRAHWEKAVRPLSSPVSSPHTVCFQTLPEHWAMVARLGRTPPATEQNLLRSGDFEDFDTMLVERWQHAQRGIDGIRANAELHPADRGGKYALRLWAFPEAGREAPAVLTRSPVSVTSPPITVHGGQIVHIGGWVRIVSPIARTLDGVLLYDSQSGPAGAIRWTDPTNGWQRFEMIREIHESGELTITAALCGLGEIQFDDLQVVAINPRLDPSGASAPRSAAAPAAADSPWSGPRRLLEQFPGFGPR